MNLEFNLRLMIRTAAIVLVTIVLLPLQLLAVALNAHVTGWIPVLFHRLVCGIVSVRVHEIGKPADTRPLLIVSNHVSWLDISVIASRRPLSFVAKREVASWPVFGLLAKLQRSIFVDRERRLKSAQMNSEIANRLREGDAIILFPEGTSGNGKTILPFRSALIGATAQTLMLMPEVSAVNVQPLSIVYSGAGRDIVPWYGDMDLLPHLAAVLRMQNVEVVLNWGEPIACQAQTDRKELTRRLESEVRTLSLHAA